MAVTMLDQRFNSKYLNSDEVDIATTEIVSFLLECNDHVNGGVENAPSGSMGYTQ